MSEVHTKKNEILEECPFCNSKHLVQVKDRQAKAIVKNLEVEYDETVYLCTVEDSEFITNKVSDENSLRAKDKYKKTMGLLTSYEIKSIRDIYDLTQKEFSNLFGWGDVTVQRYEKKLIQDETYDDMMRMTLINPSYTLMLLEKHKDRFSEDRFIQIKSNIKETIKKKGNLHLKIEEIKNGYIDFDEPSEFNGYKILNIEKIVSVIGYFIHYINPLSKAKLMNLLWYSDILSYKLYNTSITGLVYEHLQLGMCPISFNEIINLPFIKVEEELVGEAVNLKICSKDKVDILRLSLEELNVLEKVALFFKEFETRDIVEYIQKEVAYIETDKETIFSFSSSNHIKNFE